MVAQAQILERLRKLSRELEAHLSRIETLKLESENLYRQLEPYPVITPKWSKLYFPLSCKVCGRPTRWRHPKGWAQHPDGACHVPISRLGTTPLPSELWAELDKILEGELPSEL